jgi:hypothetical protein
MQPGLNSNTFNRQNKIKRTTTATVTVLLKKKSYDLKTVHYEMS